MHRILTETYRTLAASARRIRSARSAGSVSPATLWRWGRHGVRVNGQTIKLETTTHGAIVVTSDEAIARFFAACDAARSGQLVIPDTTPTAPPIRRQTEADRILDAAGIS
jgi:hypothetical protein